MTLRLKSEPTQPPHDQALVEQLIDLMRRPEFGALLAEALRAAPEFSALFAEKLGTALRVPEVASALAQTVVNAPAFLPSLRVPEVADALAQTVVNAPAFFPSLAPGQGQPPFAPLFPQDYSALPPATYTRMRAVETWGRMFKTVFDFISACRMAGDVYEFGTCNGYTARHLATAMVASGLAATSRLHLFDTFTGFPELTSAIDKASYEIKAGWDAGGNAAVPGAAERVGRMLGMLLPQDGFTINVGTFADTLTPATAHRPAALIHVDCDLYESTKVVLDRMLDFGMIQDGTVLVFDDFNCARANSEFGERRAMHEAFDANPRFSCEAWFPYGWHGQVCIVHERKVSRKRGAI
jgi:O-methyltransferase